MQWAKDYWLALHLVVGVGGADGDRTHDRVNAILLVSTLRHRAISGQRQRHGQRLIESTDARWREAGHEVGQDSLRKADEGVAMNARLVLEAVLRANLDLRRQGIAAGVDRGADDRGESGIDQGLPADDDEDP